MIWEIHIKTRAIIRLMTAYVRNFRPTPDKGPFKLPQEIEIFYSHRPELRLGTTELAEADCRFLNNIQVRVGEHLCHFEVEEVEPGVFGVVCRSHPEVKSALEHSEA